MRSLAIVLAVFAVGCASTHVSGGSAGSSGASLRVGIEGRAATAAAVAIGAMAIVYSATGAPDAPPPELLPGRTVIEQDCTKPLQDPTANLRCR